MSELDLNDVAVFVRVVDHASFAKAARELGVPTSTVSRTVARLEAELGCRLLHRTTRSLKLTSEGHEFYAGVAPAVASLREATRSVSLDPSQPKGTLRVTAPNDLGSMVLASLVVDFAARFPQVQVELELTNRRVDLVSEGFDVALRAGRMNDSSLVARKLGELDSYLYATPQYLDRHGSPESLTELSRHACVLFRPRNGRAELRLTGPRGEETVELWGRIGCDDFAFVRSAVLAGGGIGLIPHVLCAEPLSSGRLVRVLPWYRLAGAALFVVYPSARNVPPRVAAFRDFVLEKLGQGAVRRPAEE